MSDTFKACKYWRRNPDQSLRCRDGLTCIHEHNNYCELFGIPAHSDNCACIFYNVKSVFPATTILTRLEYGLTEGDLCRAKDAIHRKLLEQIREDRREYIRKHGSPPAWCSWGGDSGEDRHERMEALDRATERPAESMGLERDEH